LSLTGKRPGSKSGARPDARRRAQAVASAMSCGMCPHRCSRCGLALDAGPSSDLAPYPFCNACLEEYLAFQRAKTVTSIRTPFGTPPNGPRCGAPGWIIMRSTDAFSGSAAFMRLMQEHRNSLGRIRA
jgi:hypothetical protein